ncbi:MAG: hypothetical protein HFJ40_01890 [Clostridia bacterium]|nr:hypothetical protein [Clostridia bacterium]
MARGLVAQEVRNYVKAHKEGVTSNEVIHYILVEKEIKATENNIRSTLCKVLKGQGVQLKRESIAQEIRNYVKKHNNEVTSKEVIHYILVEKEIKTTENNIRSTLCKVLKGQGVQLKRESIAQEIRNYVNKHNNEVTSKEVIHYILVEKEIKTTKDNVRKTLWRVLKKQGVQLKREGITQEIRNYIKKHNNEVTSNEVIHYILVEKEIKTTKDNVRKTLGRVLKEQGVKLKKQNCNN